MVISINSHGVPVWRGKELDLPPKERAVLALLIKYAPIAIAKDEIIRHVWIDGNSVSDYSLTRCISQIRKSVPGIRIESIYGYGYRLEAPTIRVADSALNASTVPLTALEQYQYATSLVQQCNSKSVMQAVTVFRAIVATYPQFVLAKIALAGAIATLIGIGFEKNTDVTLREALDNLTVATELAPYLPDLTATQAWIHDITWAFDKAEKLYLDLLSKVPDSADYLLSYALHLLATSRTSDAISCLRKLLLLKPYSIHTRSLLARLLGMTGRYEDAFSELAIAEDHSAFLSHPIVEGVKVMVNAACQPSPDLIASARHLERQKNEMPPYARVCLPYVMAHCGQLDEAKQWVARQAPTQNPSPVEHIFLAKDLVAIGQFDLAAQKLKLAAQTPYGYLPFALNFPELQPISAHPIAKEIRRTLFSANKIATAPFPNNE